MNRTEARLYVEAIKKAFPSPAIKRDGDGNYCVGGAFCQYAAKANIDFPMPTTICIELYHMNSQLSWADALASAQLVISHNDKGEFAESWQTLEDALCKGSEKTT